VRTNIGKALAGRRDRVFIQGHIGAGWINDNMPAPEIWSSVNSTFNDLLTRLQTDYIDVGIFHFVDNDAHLKKYSIPISSNMLRGSKAKGIIKAIGMSSHNQR